MPGIALNEDDGHFFGTHAGQTLDAAKVTSWVDGYAQGQVKELMFCPNAMRTAYASKVWDPTWLNYDPDGPDDQPLFKSLGPGGGKGPRRWIHTAWQLAQDGIDPYRRADVVVTDWSLDYGHKEVRDHHMKLVRELIERYDFDGLELDWMRFGYHFRPGFEREGAPILTDFMVKVRRLLDKAQQKRGHKIKLGARVPSRPQTAAGLGMDAVTWARKGLVDMLVPTPFWATIEAMIGKPRHHVITYSDVWAPGEPRAIALPATVGKNELKEFRIHIGPKPKSGKVMLALGLKTDSRVTKKTQEVRVNGDICKPIGPVKLPAPGPQVPAYGFEVPLATVKRGNNLIEIVPQSKITISWVKIKISS